MKRLFLCLLLFWMFACDNTVKTPQGVIPEQKMISILTELQVAESKVKNLRIPSDSARHVFSIYEIQILNDHNVSPEQYLHSFQYYLENHRLMTRVHQAVLDTLMARQAKLENMPDMPETPLPKAFRDSIKKDSLIALGKDSVLLVNEDTTVLKELPALKAVEGRRSLADSNKIKSNKKLLPEQEPGEPDSRTRIYKQ